MTIKDVLMGIIVIGAGVDYMMDSMEWTDLIQATITISGINNKYCMTFIINYFCVL